MTSRVLGRAIISGTISKWTPSSGFMRVGMDAELKRSFSMDDVTAYAAIAGDDNAIHVDPAFAATTRFGRPIVHGMLYSSLFGTIFGATITGSVYVSQTLKFRKPVWVGSPITARLVVTSVREKPHLVTCATSIILDEDGTVATEGEAVVLLPSPSKLA